MAKYIRYILENMEPVRIADDSTSQSGQTNTLRYFPGTAMRGYLVNQTSKNESAFFEKYKEKLFSSHVCFMNACLYVDGKTVIPSPKGFYEDKASIKDAKPLKNVVTGDEIREGIKRASLGRYCYFDGPVIRYYNVDTGSDLKIKINEEKQNVFRIEYIAAHQEFEGFIRVEDEKILEMLAAYLEQGKIITLGSSRTAGLGKCLVKISEIINTVPYQETMFSEYGKCYMMLISNTVMRNKNGEYCGLDLSTLESTLGVKDLQVENCATSVIQVHGYNRTLGIKLPSVPMYEQGSVFKLIYTGTIDEEHMKAVTDQGIGIRKNEGFGRVIFLKNYEKKFSKLEGSAESVTEVPEKERKISEYEKSMNAQTLFLVAKNHYRRSIEKAMLMHVVNHPLNKNGISNSQLGIVQAIATEYRFEPSGAIDSFQKYFKHAAEKEDRQKVQKKTVSRKGIARVVDELLDNNLEETLKAELEAIGIYGKRQIMGNDVKKLITPEEEDGYKLQLLIDMIRYDMKKGGK